MSSCGFISTNCFFFFFGLRVIWDSMSRVIHEDSMMCHFFCPCMIRLKLPSSFCYLCNSCDACKTMNKTFRRNFVLRWYSVLYSYWLALYIVWLEKNIPYSFIRHLRSIQIFVLSMDFGDVIFHIIYSQHVKMVLWKIDFIIWFMLYI